MGRYRRIAATAGFDLATCYAGLNGRVRPEAVIHQSVHFLGNLSSVMLKINEIDIVVTSREFEIRLEDGRTETYLVRVGMPYERDDGFDWCCPYELGTVSNRQLHCAFGIDSIQALELAMKIIKVKIEIWERYRVDDDDAKT
jgi:hypothetical protein